MGKARPGWAKSPRLSGFAVRIWPRYRLELRPSSRPRAARAARFPSVFGTLTITRTPAFSMGSHTSRQPPDFAPESSCALDTRPKSSYHQNRASQSPRIQAREGEPSMTELTTPGVIMALCYAAAGLTIYLRALVLA